jgi:hypothetical protein
MFQDYLYFSAVNIGIGAEGTIKSVQVVTPISGRTVCIFEL